jgi:predicted aconitase with swiveling domain
MSEKIRIKGRAVFPGKAEAEAIVAPKYLQGFTNVNPMRGYTTERRHPLFKVPYTDKILCFYSPRGSGGFLAYGFGAKPAAFVHTKWSPLTVGAALQAHIPDMTDFEEDPLQYIETGDTVFVNADEGYIEITKKAK